MTASPTHRYHAGPSARLRASRICQVDVPADRAAHLFGLNLAVWRSDPTVDETPEALDRLAGDLNELPKTNRDEPVRWHLRQLALGAAGSPGQACAPGGK